MKSQMKRLGQKVAATWKGQRGEHGGPGTEQQKQQNRGNDDGYLT